MKQESLLPDLPDALRLELFSEFSELGQNFNEGRWRACGLNAGRFCEVAYCVVQGIANQAHVDKASKPPKFRDACRQLENIGSLPKSFRFILLPLLTALYEVRNTRDIGHVGSDVDPSFMDASVVMANAKWVMAEIIRHSHALPSAKAQSIVDSLSQYSSPLVWSDTDVRRVLDNNLSLDQKILLLLSSAGGRATRSELFDWLDEASKSTFNRRISALHNSRCIEAKAYGSTVQILPPGIQRISEMERGNTAIAA